MKTTAVPGKIYVTQGPRQAQHLRPPLDLVKADG